MMVDVVIGTTYTHLFFSLLASGLNEIWARTKFRRSYGFDGQDGLSVNVA